MGPCVMWGQDYSHRKKKPDPEHGNGVRTPAIELAPSACQAPG
jgi:hypothetical protein